MCMCLSLISGGATALEPSHGEGYPALSGGGDGALRGQSPHPARCPPRAQLCQERQGEEVQSLHQEEVRGVEAVFMHHWISFIYILFCKD